jgi:hypothetical protein
MNALYINQRYSMAETEFRLKFLLYKKFFCLIIFINTNPMQMRRVHGEDWEPPSDE